MLASSAGAREATGEQKGGNQCVWRAAERVVPSPCWLLAKDGTPVDRGSVLAQRAHVPTTETRDFTAQDKRGTLPYSTHLPDT
jgi:hypothetical protein